MSLVDPNVQLQNLMSLLHEGDHFILMAMKVHDTLKDDVDGFIREWAHIFHDKQLEGYSSLSFCIQFFRQRVNIVL